MSKVKNLILSTVMAASMVACSPKTPHEESREKIKKDLIVAIDDKKTPEDILEVGKENYDKIVQFIEKHGFIVTKEGEKTGYQYTFIDSKGGRHAMIYTKENNEKTNRISVRGYKNGKQNNDLKNFVGYYIGEEQAGGMDPKTNKNETEFIKRGYEEILEEINQK